MGAVYKVVYIYVCEGECDANIEYFVLKKDSESKHTKY